MPYKRPLSDGLTLDFVERWATNSRIIDVHRDALAASTRIRIALRSTVVGLKLADDGRSVDALEVATPAGKHTVQARNFILATGGVETTRLLPGSSRNIHRTSAV
jgi:predicted flavoprotein YhiN